MQLEHQQDASTTTVAMKTLSSGPDATHASLTQKASAGLEGTLEFRIELLDPVVLALLNRRVFATMLTLSALLAITFAAAAWFALRRRRDTQPSDTATQSLSLSLGRRRSGKSNDGLAATHYARVMTTTLDEHFEGDSDR